MFHPVLKNRSGDKTAFFPIGKQSVYHDLWTFVISGPYYFIKFCFVFIYNGIRGLHDVSGRAVILLQPVHLHIIVILLEVEDIINIRPPKSIDTLGIIPNHTYILKFI